MEYRLIFREIYVPQAECHSDRKLYAKGKCKQCYSKALRNSGWKSPNSPTCHPDRPLKARGLCSPCYQSVRDNGGFVPMRRERKAATCGHGGRSEARGMCKACYSTWRRRQDPVRNDLERRKDRAAVYGLTLEQYDALKAQVNCHLCGRYIATKPERHIDHCHETGRVRGMLCFTCNKGIGMLGDNEAGLLRALAYIRAEHGIVLELPGEQAA